MRQLKITRTITNRETQSLEKYFYEISKIPLISPEREVVLAERIRQGDNKALEELTKANLRFVVSVAKQYQHQGLSLSDLINEGNLGLIKAAERFDETRGFKFISYAVWRIRQSILQALAEQARIVRLPLNKVGLSNKIGKAFSQLEQEFEREPTTEELAELLDIELEQIETTLGIAGRHVSLDAPLLSGEDDSATFGDMITGSTAAEVVETLTDDTDIQILIDRSLSVLDQKDKFILIHFFGLKGHEAKGCDIIAELYEQMFNQDITRERIRQRKEKAIMKLQRHSKIRKLLLQEGIPTHGIDNRSHSNGKVETSETQKNSKANTQSAKIRSYLSQEVYDTMTTITQKQGRIAFLIANTDRPEHHKKMAMHYFVRTNTNLNITRSGQAALASYYRQEAGKWKRLLEDALKENIDFVS